MNPIMFKIGQFEIRWYAIFILIAIVAGMSLVNKEGKRLNAKSEFIFNMLFNAILVGFLCARLYYVIFKWDYYSVNVKEIFQIWKGGLAIHGGLIGAIITIFLYSKKYKARAIRYLDFLAVPLLLSQAIGRWGNFFNSEAHGVATTYEHLKSLRIPGFIIEGMKIDGIYYTPTFLYESILCLGLFIILLFMRRNSYIKVGTLTALYLIGYGLIRFSIEISRTDALTLGGFKIAQIVSITMIIVGIVILMINRRKSRFEDLYNDKNNIDNLKF